MQGEDPGEGLAGARDLGTLPVRPNNHAPFCRYTRQRYAFSRSTTQPPPAMGSLGTTEIIIIFLVVLLVFGAKRIPEIARGLGKGIREFKDATNDIKQELNVSDSARPPQQIQPPPVHQYGAPQQTAPPPPVQEQPGAPPPAAPPTEGQPPQS